MNKLSKHFGPNSGAIDDVRKAIGKKNWRSAWLLIEKRKYNWFVIGRVFWKKRKLNTIQDLGIITDTPQDEGYITVCISSWNKTKRYYYQKMSGLMIA